MTQLLWVIYLEVCLGSSCIAQEVQRFDPPQAETKCFEMLEAYVEVPADGQWDSVEWICKPLHSEGV